MSSLQKVAKSWYNFDSKSVHSHRKFGMESVDFSYKFGRKSDYREQEWMTNVPLYAASIYLAE